MSRGLLGVLGDAAIGVIIGEAVGAEEHREGAIWILVNPDDGLYEMRPQAALRQLQGRPRHLTVLSLPTVRSS